MADKEKVEILIVEDSPTQAEELKFILEENNFIITSASNGKEAMKKLSDYRPTIIISDIVMPEMDGYELCRRIKQNETLKNIPIILLTSLSGIHDIIKGLESGADNFIIKPYEEKYLLSRIYHIITNFDIQKGKKPGESVEVFFKGQKYFVSSKTYQILDFLLATYETAVQKNLELIKSQEKLVELSTQLVNTNDNLETEIMERKNAEKELMRSNEELEKFASVVSHDLQQPLLAVINYLRFIHEECEDKSVKESEEYISRAIDGSVRMQKLIRALLTYARTGKDKKPFDSVRIQNVIDTAISNLKVSIEESKAAINYENMPVVHGDEVLLIQLFQNLLDNAVKFRSDKNPEITVKAKKDDDEWLFEVRDNGIGFEQKYADRLFGMFQRLVSEEDRPGTGIGLSVCKKIAELHGGRIWTKGSPGEGSAFYFTIHENVKKTNHKNANGSE